MANKQPSEDGKWKISMEISKNMALTQFWPHNHNTTSEDNTFDHLLKLFKEKFIADYFKVRGG